MKSLSTFVIVLLILFALFTINIIAAIFINNPYISGTLLIIGFISAIIGAILFCYKYEQTEKYGFDEVFPYN